MSWGALDDNGTSDAVPSGDSWNGGVPVTIDGVQDDFQSLSFEDGNAGHNDSYNAGAGAGYGDGGPSGACRICNEEGHFARECPNKPADDGNCRFCKQEGHFARDCPDKPADADNCRVCGQEGHFARDCPDKKEPGPCRNCGEEGHRAAECEAPRLVQYDGIPDMTTDEAWQLMVKASEEKDIDDFKTAAQAYLKSDRAVTFADIESRCREAKLKIYLIALEKELPKGMTSVSPQGKVGCKYVVSYYFGASPKRAKFADGWPSSPEENLERLLIETGVPLEHVLPLCRRCNELGHTSKNCTEPQQESEQPKIVCHGCSQPGHRLRDCPEPRKIRGGPMDCRNCGGEHKAVDCTEPRSAANVECRVCNQTGHFAKDCPDKQDRGPRTCRNCGSEDHIAKECDQPRNPDMITCNNCSKAGHMSRECPDPTDWSKVKCRNCNEFGHTIKRCKQPIADDNGGGGYGGGGYSGGGDLDAGGGDNSAAAGNDENASAEAPSGEWASGAAAGSGW